MKKLILTLFTVTAVAAGVTAVSAAVGDDPAPSAADRQAVDISGPCDEAENAGDPRCTGTVVPAEEGAPDDTDEPDVVRDGDLDEDREDNSGPGSLNSGPGNAHDDKADDDSSGPGPGREEDDSSGHGSGDDDFDEGGDSSGSGSGGDDSGGSESSGSGGSDD